MKNSKPLRSKRRSASLKRSKRKTSGKTKYKIPARSKSRPKQKSEMKCNSPMKSWRQYKKRVVKACDKGKERIVHYGDTRYSHNYSPQAKRNFRSRHRCDSVKNKLSARYWACEDLWPK